MKSSPRLTGIPGGLALGDGLANVASGMGGSKDRSMLNRWSLGTDLNYGASLIDLAQIEAAYRTSWLVRKVHDIIPEEMTRSWREWSIDAEQVALIEAEEKRLKVRAAILEVARLARLRGGAGLILGLPGQAKTAAPAVASAKGLKYLVPVGRDYLSFDELEWDLESEFYGQPKMFTLTTSRVQVEVHPSRVIAFPGVPSTCGSTASEQDRFWGHPLMESLDEALKNATVAQNAIAQLLPEAMTDIVSIPGLTDMVSTQAGETRLANRLQVAKLMKSMFNIQVLDGGNGTEGSGEEWETRQLTFTGLPDVGRFLLQVAAGACDIPLTRLIGAPPEGMNATGEHDEDNFQTMIRSKQDRELRPRLERLDTFLLPSAGVADIANATWDFATLDDPSQEEQADVDDKTATAYATIKGTGLIQDDALAATLVTLLDGRPTFPGLAEAVANSTEPLPSIAEREQAATMGEAKVRALTEPTGTMKLRKPSKDALMMDAAPRMLYVSRKVLNPQELLTHYRRQGVENLIAAGDLHVSIITSTNEVDWMTLPTDWCMSEDGRTRVPAGGARVMERLGAFIVLEFSCDDLKWRHQRLVDAGVTPRWTDFKPHISVRQLNPGQAFDLSAVKPYTGRIVLGPEMFEEVM